jgi:Family of unknown function (DUF5995)
VDGSTAGIDSVVADMQLRLDALPADQRHLAEFLGTYQRTTAAVGKAVAGGLFEDADWVAEWDVAFARLYLDALDAHLSRAAVPRPWRLAFDAPPALPVLRHVLLGINAHVNYDLPQALLAVIDPADFDDPDLLARRHRDHERIDGVLAARVAAEDAVLATRGRTLLDRVLQPANRRASARFLKEAREKVWHNTRELHAARLAGDVLYDERLGELEVLLRLAVAGFGVVLPPPR